MTEVTGVSGVNSLKFDNVVGYPSRAMSCSTSYGGGRSTSLSLEQKIYQSVYQLLLMIIQFFTPNGIIDEKGRTLVAAAREGEERAVKALLKGYHCVRITSKYEALAAAVIGKNVNIAKILIEHGVYIDSITGQYGRTPLMHAITAKDNDENKILGMVEALIKDGACVNAVDKNGETPLMLAVRKNYNKVVEKLIKEGANVNCIDDHWQTALMKAAENGHKDIVRFLLCNKADVNCIDDHWQTALMKAAENGHEDIVRLLLCYGADINCVDDHWQTALMKAAEDGHQDIVAILEVEKRQRQSHLGNGEHFEMQKEAHETMPSRNPTQFKRERVSVTDIALSVLYEYTG